MNFHRINALSATLFPVLISLPALAFAAEEADITTNKHFAQCSSIASDYANTQPQYETAYEQAFDNCLSSQMQLDQAPQQMAAKMDPGYAYDDDQRVEEGPWWDDRGENNDPMADRENTDDGYYKYLGYGTEDSNEL